MSAKVVVAWIIAAITIGTCVAAVAYVMWLHRVLFWITLGAVTIIWAINTLIKYYNSDIGE